MSDRKCLRCDGSRLEPGAIESFGRSYFKIENAKFLTLHTSEIPFRGLLCLDCGFLELVGDVKKAQAVLPAGKTA